MLCIITPSWNVIQNCTGSQCSWIRHGVRCSVLLRLKIICAATLLWPSRKCDWKIKNFNNRYYWRSPEQLKMHRKRAELAGASPRPHWGSLHRSSRPPNWNRGAKKTGREWEERRNEELKRGRGTGKSWILTMFGTDWTTAHHLAPTHLPLVCGTMGHFIFS